MVLLPTPNKVW